MDRSTQQDVPSREDLLTLSKVADLPSSESALSGSATRIARLVWEQRRLVGRFVLAGAVACVLVAFLLPDQYECNVELMPPDTQSSAGMAMLSALTGRAGGGLGLLASDMLGMKSTGALFVDMLKSEALQDRIINRLDLRKAYRKRYYVDTRKRLARNTDISEDRKSGTVRLSVTDQDKYRTQLIATAYVQELDRTVAQVSTSSARRERIFIEDRLTKVKTDLDRAATEFSQYASTSGAIDVKEQTRAMVDAAAKLQGELIAEQSQLEGLEQVYTANNVRVKSLRARVDELKHQLNLLGGVNDGAKPQPPYNSRSELSPSIRQLPVLGVKWADLYRETKVQETVYELLTEQYEMAKIQEAKEIPTVKVLTPPVTPEKRSGPPRLIIILAGTLLSLIAGMAWVVGNAYWAALEPDNEARNLAQEVFSAGTAWVRRKPRAGTIPGHFRDGEPRQDVHD